MAESRAEYNERMRIYMAARYEARRAQAVELLGSRCVECGGTEDLEIDHVDPKLKTMSVNRMCYVAEARFLAELANCQLLCKPHHINKSRRERSVPHGGGASGKKNCSCALCKARKAEYMRNYHRPPVAEMV